MSKPSIEIPPRFILISGPLGAGKNTAADHFAQTEGLLHVSSSDILRDEARERGAEADREGLSAVALELHREYDTLGALTLLCMERWQAQMDEYSAGLVISGIRIVADAQEAKDHQAKLLYVDAPRHIRIQRILARNRDGDAQVSVEARTERDIVEYEGTDDPGAPCLRGIQSLSHVVLQNDRTIPELHSLLDNSPRLTV